MKKLLTTMIVVMTALVVVTSFGARREELKAAVTDSPIVIRTSQGDVLELRNFPGEIEYGDPNPTGDLYLNGAPVPKGQYSFQYQHEDDSYGLLSYYRAFKTGKFYANLVMTNHNVEKIATFTVKKGNIANLDITLPDKTVLDFCYYAPSGTINIDGSDIFMNYMDCKSVLGNDANPGNRSAGTGTVTFDAADSDLLYGKKTVNYTIHKADLSAVDYKITTEANMDYTFNGEPKCPKVWICCESNSASYQVKESEVTFKNNINAGTATVTVRSNNFIGTATGTFEILPFDLSAGGYDYEKQHFTYTGSAIKPKLSCFSITYRRNGITNDLLRDIDYEITGYGENKNFGTGTISVKGIGNYKGETEYRFQIDRKSIEDAEITVPDYTQPDSYDSIKSCIKVVLNGKTLKENEDYVIYSPYNYGSGNYFTVDGRGNYCSEVKIPYSPKPVDLAKAEIRIKNSGTYVYTGSFITPEIEICVKDVKGGSVILPSGYYSVTYKDNLNVGDGKITVTSNDGSVIGSKTVTFKITPCDASKLTISAPRGNYEGKVLEPSVRFGDFSVPRESYDLSLDNEGTGTVNARFVFKGNFKGERTITYELKGNLSGAAIKTITFEGSSDPSDKTVNVSADLKLGKATLVQGRDYAVDSHYYQSDSNILSLRIIGIGAYEGEIIKALDMEPYYGELGNLGELMIPDMTFGSERPEPYFDKGDRKVTLDDMTELGYFPKVSCQGSGTSTGRLSLSLMLSDFTLVMVKSYNINPAPTAAPTATAAPSATPVVTAAPTSTTAPSVTAVPTVIGKVPTATPAVSILPGEQIIPSDGDPQIMDFVDRIYIYVLDREPEATGAAFWTEELSSYRRTGAEVGLQFIFSDEFTARGLSDSDFITVLYRTFFGREPEEEGMNYWLSNLSSGAMDRQSVANGFVYSKEWADTCASYGIRSGGELEPTGSIQPTSLTYAFVERMYTTAMGRNYDEEGRQYWASELANFNVTGEAVGASFFLSDEMASYGLSDDDFLARLYQTFMDREADFDGASYWLGIMASGASRSDVVFGFTRSPEFTAKCAEAGILPY